MRQARESSRSLHNITVIRGDGIGPEVAEATIRVIEATGVRCNWIEVPTRTSIIHKANDLQLTDSLFLRTVARIAARYTDLDVVDAEVDYCAYNLVSHPEQWDLLLVSKSRRSEPCQSGCAYPLRSNDARLSWWDFRHDKDSGCGNRRHQGGPNAPP